MNAKVGKKGVQAMTRLKIFILVLVSFNVLLAQKMNVPAFLKKIHEPRSLAAFHIVPHTPPMNQDTTSACWAFATTSFLESEMQRLGRDSVRLSMMFPFFHAYVEKMRRFVQTHGHSRVAPGGLFPDVMQIVQKYGIVPYAVYTGLPKGHKRYNQRALYRAIDSLKNRVRELQIWDEDLVLQKTRLILYRYLGVPPQSFSYKGTMYTPRSFLKKVVRLPWQNYLMVTSFEYAPYFQFTELRVPDNWARNDRYFNVPLNLFYNSLKKALQRGYPVAFDADISEPGRVGQYDVSFIPPYDIPGKFIDAQAREYRFKNHCTTDDHLMLFLGYRRLHGDDWFLVKDSWRDAWQGKFPGYFLDHGDYVKLKVLAFLVNKNAVPEITKHGASATESNPQN